MLFLWCALEIRHKSYICMIVLLIAKWHDMSCVHLTADLPQPAAEN